MSKVKSVLCLVLALAMVFALSVPAFAQDDEIEPQNVGSCARCGGTSFSYTTSWGDWLTTGTTNCQHGRSGVDLYQTRRGTRAHYCTSCGRVAINESVSESRLYCTAG